MTPPTYTPYASGTTKPFSIGLSALDPRRWIEPDEDLGRYLDEKKRLEVEHYHDIFRAASESLDAQRECLDLLVQHIGVQAFRAHESHLLLKPLPFCPGVVELMVKRHQLLAHL